VEGDIKGSNPLNMIQKKRMAYGREKKIIPTVMGDYNFSWR
jgi:hypothetical protein